MSTKTLMTASWKFGASLSRSGSPWAPPMVKASRDQSAEAPMRLSWPMMVPRVFTFCCQTRSMNFSRPISVRDGSWFAAISRSVTIWVAMPAWSVPGCQSVS